MSNKTSSADSCTGNAAQCSADSYAAFAAGSCPECRRNPRIADRAPRIARFDYAHLGRIVVNRVCLTCKHHWWAGKEYTRAQWDALMNDSASSSSTKVNHE